MPMREEFIMDEWCLMRHLYLISSDAYECMCFKTASFMCKTQYVSLKGANLVRWTLIKRYLDFRCNCIYSKFRPLITNQYFHLSAFISWLEYAFFKEFNIRIVKTSHCQILNDIMNETVELRNLTLDSKKKKLC